MLLLAIILAFINVSMNSSETNWEQKLRKNLLKDYMSDDPPSSNTTVTISFALKQFAFTKTEEQFSIHVWTFISWNDPRLKWKPEDYVNVDKINMLAFVLWKPWTLFKSMDVLYDKYGLDIVYSTKCQISSIGFVSCFLNQLHKTSCTSKLDDWPYDIQYCTFKFVTENFKRRGNDTITYFFPSKRGISAFGAEYGAEWDIIDCASRINGTVLQIDFVVERQALGLVTVIVVPSVIVAILTLSTMLLDVKSNIRIVVVSFSAIAHFSVLKIVSVNLPHYGVDNPKLVSFIHISVYITACVAVLTIVLNVIQKKISSVRSIATINEFVSNTPTRYVVFPKWRAVASNENTEASRSVAEESAYFASLVNSLFLYIFVVVYLISYFILMPKQTSVD